MNCLHKFTIETLLQCSFSHNQLSRRHQTPILNMIPRNERQQNVVKNAYSADASGVDINAIEEGTAKSEVYSDNMTKAMGAVLTYRHELGMNYNFVLPRLIVGSCLQTPIDVDNLRKLGVRTIFCLQKDSDLEYFGIDIGAIIDHCQKCEDIMHCRAEINDFDAFDLRMRLPAVVSKLHKTINKNGGLTYIHCTAGLGRAPAVAVAYMFWILGYGLNEANKFLQSKRSCFPKLEAIKSATADILTGISKNSVTLTWENSNCRSVEVSGLDIGWGQRIPLTYDSEQGRWVLHRELPEGRYEYKYIIDGEWTCNENELLTNTNTNNGHVNNYIEVFDDSASVAERELRKRLTGADVDLSKQERLMIREFLEQYAG